MKILLKDVATVTAFNTYVMNKEFNVDLKTGRYIIDAKSLMGIYSLNLTNPLEVEVWNVTMEEKSEFENFCKNLGIVVE